MCDFVCGTVSHAKSSLGWSVYIHNQVTFEWLGNVYLKYAETSGPVAVLQHTAYLFLNLYEALNHHSFNELINGTEYCYKADTTTQI